MTVSADSAAVAPRSQQRLPDFFIVGHHKSGTTALYEMLRGHPEIFMPALKEPRFFAEDLRAQFEPQPTGRLPHTLDEYLDLFAQARADQLIGEASPSYLRSSTAAAAIAQLVPHARIIAIFREPASFVRSLHMQLMQDHVERERDLRRAVANEELVRNGRRVRRYSDHVRYVEQLRRFHAVFAREQVLVLIYEEFRADNEATLRRVLRFLGVDERADIPIRHANPSVSVRSPRLHALTSKLYGGGGPLARRARRALRALTGERQRAALQGLRRRLLLSEPPAPDERVMDELRRRFKPEVEALSGYIGRDLVTAWGYHELD
jgi:hypothetical protein